MPIYSKCLRKNMVFIVSRKDHENKQPGAAPIHSRMAGLGCKSTKRLNTPAVAEKKGADGVPLRVVRFRLE